MNRPLLIVVLAIGGIAALCVVSQIIFESAPVRSDRLQKVQVGLKREQVKEILGQPSNVYNEDKMWSYTGWGWAIVYVDFDEQGRVKRIRYDK